MASKSSAPKTPDYLGASLAQGQLSKESALSQTGLNRPNEVTPYGTRTWTKTASAPTAPSTPTPTVPTVGNPNTPTIQPGVNPFGGRIMSSSGGFNRTRANTAATSSGGRSLASTVTDAFKNGPNPYASLLKQSNESIINPGDWTVTTELSPEQQAILDQSNEYKMLAGGMAKNSLSSFGNQAGINFTNPDVRKSDVQTTQLNNFNGAPVNVTADSMQRFDGAPVGLSDLGYTQDSFANQRQSIEDAIFNRSKRMLDPTYAQQEQAMRSRLANQGLAEGSEAYRTEMENFSRDRANAYQNAADSAILAGGQEQSRLVSDLLATRNQDLQNQLSRYDTGLKTTDFNNQASQTDFSNRLQGGLAGFNTGLQANQANNQTAQNQFSQGLAANQANSQYDLQLMQSLLGARGQALNEAQALNNGTGVTQPQFGGFAGAGASNPADIMGALQNTYGANLAGVNAQNANAAATNQGLSSMAMMALMLSDRRLKSNIKPIGTGFRGLTVYSYDIFGKRDTGYMAQEVQAVVPEAVIENPAGFLMVNYGLLGGKP